MFVRRRVLEKAGKKSMEQFDRIIIGAGLYGLYGARASAAKGMRVLVLEYDNQAFSRATYINQARVHMGYHYPRSLSTAMKSAGYFRRFNEEFSFSIHRAFQQIYATSALFSWTNAEEFRDFCRAAGIRCDSVSVERYFKPGMCDGAFLTEEYTYDAMALRDYFLEKLADEPGVTILYGVRIRSIFRTSSGECWAVSFRQGEQTEIVSAPYLLNATYASTNQILGMVREEDRKSGQFSPFGIKYELCEIILCRAEGPLKDTGITVMDGPFFSIMPFGLTGLHSLTAVTFTPHVTSYASLPSFQCQKGIGCSPEQLDNCSLCSHKPATAWPYMRHLADKYLKPEYAYSYEKSLFSMKPILMSSEVDDSRPTCIRVNSRKPMFLSVLSGKINTVYDLDEFL